MGSYVYRRELTRDELLPALGVGLGVGLGVAVVTAYVTQIFLRRTPLRRADEPRPRHSRASGNPGAAPTHVDPRFRGDDETGPADARLHENDGVHRHDGGRAP